MKIKQWFEERGITDAVVGYSGGVDSCVTAVLLTTLGIKVTLVIAESPNQKYSSPLAGIEGARYLQARFGVHSYKRVRYSWPFSEEEIVANEAAGPIIRNAIFYGVAAELREQGYMTVVAGTANFSEAAFLGFWGKASDGAQDVYPISHFSKLEVYAAARELDVPKAIIDAIPSGDLFFTKTNDHKMIGATYDQIEHVIYCAEYQKTSLKEAILAVDNPEVFKDNIRRNSFKYELPFPGFHINDRLERFRQNCYPLLLKIAREQ